jgi:hypothetical protein
MSKGFLHFLHLLHVRLGTLLRASFDTSTRIMGSQRRDGK